jgi:hypothetical protein
MAGGHRYAAGVTAKTLYRDLLRRYPGRLNACGKGFDIVPEHRIVLLLRQAAGNDTELDQSLRNLRCLDEGGHLGADRADDRIRRLRRR